MVSHFSYSGQSQNVYQASRSAELVMSSSNRLRSESGSSESSRGSGSTESGKSRRRSHRPRGCRGGSNRRRNNSGEGKKKTQRNDTPIIGDFHGNGAIRGRKFSYNINGSSNIDASLTPHHTQYTLQRAYSGYSNGFSNSGFPIGQLPMKGFGIAEFPPLQSSFSESSNEIFPEHDDNQILPPMPLEAFQDQRPIPTGPNPYALNTSTSIRGTFFPTTLGQSSVGMVSPYTAPSVPSPPAPAASQTRSYPPGILQPLTHVRGNGCHNINVGELLPGIGKECTFISLDKSASVVNDEDNGYRAERLEKQRQNVEGGSLFVTSPRSFLMGVKNSFHDPSAAAGSSTVSSF